MARPFAFLAALTLFATGCSGGDIPPATLEALRNAETYELISLSPDRQAAKTTPPAELFHNWQVLGRTAVADPKVRTQLTDALRKGAQENKGMVAGCFNPRHGIRVTGGGKTVDLVICFECMSTQIFEGDTPAKQFLLTASPQPVFDEVLKKAGVALAPRGDE